MTTAGSVVATFNTSPAGPVLLTNGQQATVSGAMDNFTDFMLDVPSGASNLGISISGGTGDADLYVKLGALPTLSVYDCRPYFGGNQETCTFTAPAQGRYYVRLHAYSTFSNAVLSVAFTGATQSFNLDVSRIGTGLARSPAILPASVETAPAAPPTPQVPVLRWRRRLRRAPSLPDGRAPAPAPARAPSP